MNGFEVQNQWAKAAQRERQALTDAERERRDREQAAIGWVYAQPEFADLVDECRHRCQWLVVAALRLREKGKPFGPADVRALRDRLIPAGQAEYWTEGR